MYKYLEIINLTFNGVNLLYVSTCAMIYHYNVLNIIFDIALSTKHVEK